MKDFIKYALYILKFALYILWLLVGGIIFLPLTHAWALDSLEELYTHLIALVIYVALTVFAIFLSNVWESHKKKKKEKERAAYEALYVTQSTLHDERFGDIVYRWDTKKQSLLDASVKLPPFAGYTVELSAESGDGMNEAAIAAYIPAALAAVYDRQQEILPGLCAVVKETYDDEGIQDAMKCGTLGGFPVVGIKANCYDGSYHEVDSSEMAFHVAGSMCFKEAMKKAEPVLLEPIMKVEVTMPEEYMGDVIGDINSRRGRIEGMEDVGNGKQVIGYVPLSAMFGYATDLRSRTQGRGNYSMFFERYEPVPKNVAAKILSHGE